MESSTSANSTNTASKGSEGENSDSNPFFGIATLGFLGGTGYWDTRSLKENKKYIKVEIYGTVNVKNVK